MNTNLPLPSVAIIGIGRMGLNHLAASLDLNMQVSRLFDTNVENLEKAVSQYSLDTETCDSIDAFFDDLKADLLIIATTADSHYELINRAVAAGIKRILCEKPLVRSVAHIEAIENLIKESGVSLAVNHQMRYLNQYTKVLEKQKKFQLGQLTSASFSGANFGLGMNVTHYFEAFRYLTGVEIRDVWARLDVDPITNVRGNQFSDASGVVFAENPMGQKLFVDFQLGSGHQVLAVYNFRNGKIVVNEIEGKLSVISRLEESLDLPTNRYGAPSRTENFEILGVDIRTSTRDLIEALLSEGDFPDFEVGAHSVRCAFAAIRSQLSGSSAVNIYDPQLSKMDEVYWA